jgi:DNA modification methylase
MADQIGLEQTPDAFVAELVAVFREVRRVLRDDGTLWLNLGDSYYNTNPGSGGKCVLPGAGKSMTEGRYHNAVRDFSNTNLKPKDLIGIPWRVAFALQADGWYLRQDIIWHKPNPMPESVKDRCTKAHEYIFLLSKSDRYYYDADAIREPHESLEATARRTNQHNKGTKYEARPDMGSGDGRARTDLFHENGRNKRSVWTVTPQPFKGAHFATFPPALIEPCILAGCPEGGVVLDPFGGAGTTGLVADRLGRDAVLCELNPTYAQMAADRIKNENPMFTNVEIANG